MHQKTSNAAIKSNSSLLKFIMRLLILFLLFTSTIKLFAQSKNILTKQSIGWYNLFATIKTGSKTSVHAEYQFRRVNIITNGQQSLLRTGINYHINNNLLVRAGYAFVQTFPYGEIAINTYGKAFDEHRLYQLIQYSSTTNTLSLFHRFMVEQRWIGSYSNATLQKEDSYLILHRMRYMLRAQIPLTINKINPVYVSAYNEFFVGIGNNVNIFDQNRLAILLGKTLNKHVKIELGYLNQFLKLNRKVNNQNVLQHNNGFMINSNFTF